MYIEKAHNKPHVPTMLSACMLAGLAVYPHAQQYFKLRCKLEIGSSILDTGTYDARFFDGMPCGMACASTALDTIGTREESADGAIFSAERAEATLEAIVASHHCRCSFQLGWFSLGCDCSLWTALKEEKWGLGPTQESKRFRAKLERFAVHAAEMIENVRSAVRMANEELKMLCGANPTLCAPFEQQENALKKTDL